MPVEQGRIPVASSALQHRARHGLVLAGIAAAYFVAGKLGLYFAFVHASATAVWPPTGIALAAILLLGYRTWPAIFAGAFLTNIATAGSLLSSLGIAVGNTAEALVGAYLVSRYAGGAAAFFRAQDVLRFAVLAGLVSTAVSATIGVASLVLTGYAQWAQFTSIWTTWWLGDAAGALIVAPALLLWSKLPGPASLHERFSEAVLLFLAIAAAGALVFTHPALDRYPLPFLCLPPLVWAALRFGPREVATGVLLLSAIALWATVRGLGPFAMQPAHESLLILQAFMVTLAVMTLPIAGLVWERQRLDEERSVLLDRERAARATAEVANRAKDEFLAMLSHELRNPTAAISNAAQVLARPDGPSQFGHSAVEIIQRQAKQLGRLIDDLLDVARVTAGKIALRRETVNIADSVAHCVEILRSTGRLRRHAVECDLAPAWTHADPARLQQVIDNLLTNAIKFTPAEGVIRVRTHVAGEDAVLQVEDSGIGIAPDALARVFDLFMQDDPGPHRAHGGLGIGLTLVRSLVEQHGGTVSVHSEGRNKGCAFTVRLPGASIAPAPLPRAEPPDDVRTPLRVLIVEDTPDVREALRMQLVLAGHDVYEAGDGPAAVAEARRLAPDVALVDIGLPGMDGYDVARAIRPMRSGLRLIALSGYGQPEDKARARTAGFDAHLVKPIDPAELMRLLRTPAGG